MLNATLMANGEAMPRRRIERTIDYLIALLDSLDGDTDLEPDNAGTIGWWNDAEGDDADSESSLGWTDRVEQCGAGWFGDNDPHGLEREFDPVDECEGLDTEDLEDNDNEGWVQPTNLLFMGEAA